MTSSRRRKGESRCESHMKFPVIESLLKRGSLIPENSKIHRIALEFRWISLVIVGSIAPLLAILTSGYTLAWRDTSQLFAPMRSLIAESLRNGQLPLWNPYEAMGMPLFAQLLHGVLHPWSVLAAFATRGDGIDLLVLLHIATGAVGAGVLARSLGASRSGAAVAGLSYGLSGYLPGMSAVIQYLAAGGSAPWAVAGLLLAARGGPVRLMVGALGVAVLNFAGDPQWAIVASLLGFLLAWDAGGREGLGWAIAAVVAGIGLASVQLLPTWEFLQVSSRGTGLSAPDRLQWAFAPARLIEFVIPGFFAGRPGPTPASVFLWLGGQSIYPIPFLPSVFLGLPVLILAVSGIRTGRVPRLLGWAALFSLWLSLGHFFGADRVFGWVPVWGSFRYAEKLIGPFTLCVSLLAGLGLERFVGGVLPRIARYTRICTLATVLLAALSAGFVRWTPRVSHIPENVWGLLGERFAEGLLVAALGLAVIVIAGFVQSRGVGDGPSRTRATIFVLVAVLVTGFYSSVSALHIGVQDSRARSPLVELRAKNQVTRVLTPGQDIVLPINRGLDDFDGYQAVRSRSGVAPYTVPSQVDNFTTYTGLLPRKFNNLATAFNALGDARFVMYRRFALTHIVLTEITSPAEEAMARAATIGGRLVRFDREWGISIWEVPHRPWASFAERTLSVPNEEESIAAVVELESAGNRTVVLAGKQPATLTRGVVRTIERTPEGIRIIAETPGNGLLVVSDAYWDGWEATIDGRPVEIHLADGLVRAVRWPAGRHVLEMAYKPAEVRIGTTISGVTAVLLLAYVMWGGRRNGAA